MANQQVAESLKITKGKRQRVRKGPYNQYLRDSDPFRTAPSAFNSIENRNDTNEAFPLQTNPQTCTKIVPKHCDNSSETDELQFDDENSEHDILKENMQEQITLCDGELNDCELATESEVIGVNFIKEAISQKKLVNDSPDDHSKSENDNSNFEVLDESVESSDSEDLEEDRQQTYPTEIREETVHSQTSLSVGASMMLIMSFALKHSLTREGLQDLLSLIELHCPSENKIPKSVGQFRKWFENVKDPLVFHKYCSSCHMYLTEGEIKIDNCPNEKCGVNLNDENISHFIEIPIKKQIETMFASQDFLHDIHHRFNREKKQKTAIEDIYDGSIYKNLAKPNCILNHPYNLSLLWNTDGIPCFKSSKMSLWPLYFQINELPYHKRTDPDNMILGGLWFGSQKPSIMCFTEPFLQKLIDLQDNGLQFSDENGDVRNCRVIVVGGTADMPARSLICNTIQFNGKFGCCKCLQPGETKKTQKGGHVHIFPFDESSPNGPPRTHAGIVKDTLSAVEGGKPCNGIKGPNVFQCLKYYDLAKSTCIDYMHGILLGVTKLLMTLWFSSEYRTEAFSIIDSLDIVDARLTNIKPPNSINRTPRSIKQHVKYWKASELRSWLLFYSAPILWDIQDLEYLKHYLLLVNAIFILLQSSITVDDLKKSQNFLMRFVGMFSAFYGDRYMTCNMHQLVHLPQMVFDMGPLWAYSCFSFENCNGILLKLFHGTQHIDLQIAQTVTLMQRLPLMKNHYIKGSTPEMALYNSMKGISQNCDKLLEGNIYIIGAVKSDKIPKDQYDILSKFLAQNLMHYLTFNRIKIKNEVFHSKNYQKCRVRNSYTIAFKKEQINKMIICVGQVEYYLQLQQCKRHKSLTSQCHCSPANVAMVRCFESIQKPEIFAQLKHVFVIKTEINSRFCVVPLQDILFKCVLVDLKNSEFSYACKMPNNLERL